MIAGSTPQTTDGRLKSEAQAYVVYDGTTGEILHIHHSVTFPHGAPPREKPEARARRFAGKKCGANTEVLKVEPAAVNHSGPMRVDTVKREIVRA
jgi:hypothetical protein